jgi:hypothetical protein
VGKKNDIKYICSVLLITLASAGTVEAQTRTAGSCSFDISHFSKDVDYWGLRMVMLGLKTNHGSETIENYILESLCDYLPGSEFTITGLKAQGSQWEWPESEGYSIVRVDDGSCVTNIFFGQENGSMGVKAGESICDRNWEIVNEIIIDGNTEYRIRCSNGSERTAIERPLQESPNITLAGRYYHDIRTAAQNYCSK